MLLCPLLAPSGEGVAKYCRLSDSVERITLSNESMEDAELIVTPDAEVTDEHEEWTAECT